MRRNIPSIYCSWTQVALGAPEMCFLACGDWKHLDLFEKHTCLWPGAQILFRHKWIKLPTASLLLHFVDEYSCLGYWNEFFHLCFRFWMNFLRIAPLRKSFQLDSGKDLSTNEMIFEFFVEIRLFWLTSCLFGNLQKLLKPVSLLTTSSLFDNQFDGYSRLFFKCACTF